MDRDTSSEHVVSALRQLRLRYEGACVRCGLPLTKGAFALYDPNTRTVQCIECPPEASVEAAIDLGTAGASALREHNRREVKREERVKGRFGSRLGAVILAVADEPQSTRAWEQGARGEAELAESLAQLPEVVALYDRAVPGTRGNIDAIVVAPAGVFVVDAKRYDGLIQVRDKGGLFRTDLRLYVGHRDCTKLAENMTWQIEAVERVLAAASGERPPRVSPVLCFVNGEWPLLRRPEAFRGVRLDGVRSIRKLLIREHVLDEAAIEHLASVLAAAFPPK